MLGSNGVRPGKRRRGSVLVEFALIALVLYLILAATLEFGRALFGAQVLQQAADTAAREISRTPGLPVTGTLTEVLYSSDPAYASVRQCVFNESLLKIKYSDITAAIGDNPLVTYFDDKPILNRLLFPLMVMVKDDQGTTYLQYPGIVPVSSPVANGNTFQIAVVSSYAQGAGAFDGSEGSISYVPVIQEIGANPTDPTTSPFNLASSVTPASNRGIVAIRINYPFQAATLSATAPNPAATDHDSRFDPNFHFVEVPASDAGASPGPYSGSNGLGVQYAAARTVRPFRRLISAQAIYRREVF